MMDVETQEPDPNVLVRQLEQAVGTAEAELSDPRQEYFCFAARYIPVVIAEVLLIILACSCLFLSLSVEGLFAFISTVMMNNGHVRLCVYVYNSTGRRNVGFKMGLHL